jgi:hypothetical protein
MSGGSYMVAENCQKLFSNFLLGNFLEINIFLKTFKSTIKFKKDTNKSKTKVK